MGRHATSAGSLTFVGTGLSLAGHVTQEALSVITDAGKLFYLVNNAVTAHWLRELQPGAESLQDLYAQGRPREETYEAMVQRILAPALAGERVVVALYGHPGIFVSPSHEAMRRARAAGIATSMLPAVSTEDCLFADLGVDPGERGCQSFEATDFLLRRRRFDTTSSLVLWQIGGIGVSDFREEALWNRPGLELLARELGRHYPPEHEVVVYEAVPFPTLPPVIVRVALAALSTAPVTVRSTLYVPPLPDRPSDPEMRAALGMTPESGT